MYAQLRAMCNYYANGANGLSTIFFTSCQFVSLYDSFPTFPTFPTAIARSIPARLQQLVHIIGNLLVCYFALTQIVMPVVDTDHALQFVIQTSLSNMWMNL